MADTNLITNNYLQQLNSQIADPQGYPNIPTNRYFSVERLLKNAVNFSYGVRNLAGSLTIDFLVLTVQGSLTKNVNSMVFLANKTVVLKVKPKPLDSGLILHTPLNAGVSVSVKKVMANGGLAVFSSSAIVTDFSNIPLPFLSVPRALAESWGFK